MLSILLCLIQDFYLSSQEINDFNFYDDSQQRNLSGFFSVYPYCCVDILPFWVFFYFIHSFSRSITYICSNLRNFFIYLVISWFVICHNTHWQITLYCSFVQTLQIVFLAFNTYMYVVILWFVKCLDMHWKITLLHILKEHRL